METHIDKTMEKLKELAKEHLYKLKPHKHYKGRFKVKGIHVEGYQDIFFTIESLIGVCIIVLETAEFSNINSVVEPNAHVRTVLELVIKMIPFEEWEFLDEIGKLLAKENDME
ncbi:MAG: hypothetical protein WBG90_09435 [Saonia sp.]